MPSWKSLINAEIQSFIRSHENTDVTALALKKPPDLSWPYPLILDQIKSRQKAKDKIPGWYKTENIVFPSPSLIEQASSEATAKYKSYLVSSLRKQGSSEEPQRSPLSRGMQGRVFADLTAGAGIDFHALLENFEEGIAVEQDGQAAEILAHNLSLLTQKKFSVQIGKAEDLTKNLPACDLVYIDPQRRTDKGKGLFRFTDCSPDIISLLPLLKTKTMMIKSSPVLDIDKAIAELGNVVAAVHVVEWRGDCREVLYLLQENASADIPVTAVTIDDHGRPVHSFTFTREQERESPACTSMPQVYLYEPSPAFQKAGCFKYLALHFGVQKLHPHTHLYTSADLKENFPGRRFRIEGVYSAGGKDLRLKKANITVRNFPMGADDLRRKLKLEDGGEDTLFACTLAEDTKALIHARKA